mgnify:CR=1 FL=1
MNNFEEFKEEYKVKAYKGPVPGDYFHPGEYLYDELEATGITQKELSIKAGLAYTMVNEIIKGKRSITALTALKIQKAIGFPAAVLLRLQNTYDLYLVQKEHPELAL